MKRPKVGIGHRMELVYTLNIPDTQKLNHGAPSNVTIFEKSKGEKVWTAVKELSLNNRAWENSRLGLKEMVELKDTEFTDIPQVFPFKFCKAAKPILPI